MVTSRVVQEVLRGADVPLAAGLIAEIVGAETADVEALLAQLERKGLVRHREEWTAVGAGRR